MWDKRKSERKTPIGIFQVYDRYNNRLIGKLRNLSQGGLMVEASKALIPGETYSLRIDMPNEIENRSRINLDAVCRWCRRDDETREIRSGLEFANIPDSDRRMVEILLSKWTRNLNGVTGNNLDVD